MNTNKEAWMQYALKSIVLILCIVFTHVVAASQTVRYQHTDMLGSVISESDAVGNIISRSHYEPFGKRIGGDKEGLGYTGHLQDKDLGLTYMQARYYDPLIGRFYSNDPIGFTGEVDTFNRYSYVANNPYKYTDPTGEAKSDGDAGAALGALILDIINNPDAWKPKKIDGAGTLKNNNANGKSFEKHIKNKIESNTPSNVKVSEQVTIKVNDGTRTAMDLVVTDGNSTVCVECKASDTAPLTGNQKKAHPRIADSGGEVRGAGKPAVPGGTQIKPSKVIVARPRRR
jgi:RHS repeat-associated protein